MQVMACSIALSRYLQIYQTLNEPTSSVFTALIPNDPRKMLVQNLSKSGERRHCDRRDLSDVLLHVEHDLEPRASANPSCLLLD